MKKLLLTIIFVLILAGQGRGATHYFADAGSGGSDSNSGTYSSPWLSISKMETECTTSDICLLMCGDTWSGDTLNPNASTTYGAWYGSGTRVTSISDIPGSCSARPIIDNGTQVGRTIQGAASGVTIQYLDVRGGEDAIRPYTDWIIEYNLIGRGTNKYGIRSVDSQGGVSGVTIRYNTFDTHCDWVSTACTTETRIVDADGDGIPRDAINANHYDDDSWLVYGNYITDWFHSGIEIGQFEGDAPDNWEVYGNYIVKNAGYAAGFVDIDQGIALKGNTNHKIHDNVMKNIGQGITVEGGTGHRIYRNIVVGSAFGHLASNPFERWYAWLGRLLGIRNALAATPIESTSFHYKVQVVDTDHTVINDIVFQNNLSYGCRAKYAYHVITNAGDDSLSISNVTFINNIAVNCGDDNEEYCFGTRDTKGTITHDEIYWLNNIAYNAGDTGNDCGAGSNEECIAKIEVSAGVEDELSITELNALNWNTGNIEDDPLLKNPDETNGDFTLDTGSPCQEAGLDVVGYEDDLIDPTHDDIDADWPETAAAPITYIDRNGMMDIGPYAFSDDPPANKGGLFGG